MRSVAIVVTLVTFISGCAVEDADLEGRPCLDGRCPQGFACDLSGGAPGICRAAINPMDAGRDSGEDRFDAGPPFDAGRRDTGAPDGGAGTGCANPMHIFCEDFESGNIGRWTNRFSGTSTVEVSSVAARSGMYSVRATSAAPNERALIYVPAFEGMTVPDQWMRAFYLFPAGSPAETSIMDVGDATFEAGVIVDVIDFGTMGWASSYDMGMVFDGNVSVSLDTDTWICVELHVEQGPNGAVELFVDGNLESNRVGVDTTGPGTLQNVAVGSWSFAPSGARLVYVDDVVISTVPIGCM